MAVMYACALSSCLSRHGRAKREETPVLWFGGCREREGARYADRFTGLKCGRELGNTLVDDVCDVQSKTRDEENAEEGTHASDVCFEVCLDDRVPRSGLKHISSVKLKVQSGKERAGIAGDGYLRI